MNAGRRPRVSRHPAGKRPYVYTTMVMHKDDCAQYQRERISSVCVAHRHRLAPETGGLDVHCPCKPEIIGTNAGLEHTEEQHPW